jgi:hypothetical protein
VKGWKVLIPDSKHDMLYPMEVQTQNFGKHIPFPWSQILIPVYRLHSSPGNHESCYSFKYSVVVLPLYMYITILKF